MFNKIVLVDNTGLHPWAIEELQELSPNKIEVYTNDPESDYEALDRIQEADCVFVSWRTQLRESILSKCNKLKYIGMCCSLYDPASANVDIKFAEKNNIIVKGIRDYGDEGVIEFIISATILLIKGIGKAQWKDEPIELGGLNIGIIGMGTTGKMLAKAFQAFGANIYYYSRTEKPELESENIHFLPLNKLLQKVDIISTHLPKHSQVMNQSEFETFGNGKVIINTSLGLSFDKDAFSNWIGNKTNFAIFDGEGLKPFADEFSNCDNVIYTPLTTGWTKEAKVRLSKKVIENVKQFLS